MGRPVFSLHSSHSGASRFGYILNWLPASNLFQIEDFKKSKKTSWTDMSTTGTLCVLVRNALGCTLLVRNALLGVCLCGMPCLWSVYACAECLAEFSACAECLAVRVLVRNAWQQACVSLCGAPCCACACAVRLAGSLKHDQDWNYAITKHFTCVITLVSEQYQTSRNTLSATRLIQFS